MLSIKKTGGSASYPLPLLTGEALDSLSTWYDNGRFDELTNTLDTWTAPKMPPRRVGSLAWPVVGASRFASAVLPVDAWTLTQLRADLAGTNAVTLTYNDGIGPDQTVLMYVIASRPVSRTNVLDTDVSLVASPAPNVDDLWLVTLVDARWYWVQETGTGESSAYAPASWSDLFAVLFGTCINAGGYSLDTVDSDYSTPGARWTGKNTERVSVAYLLDDAAQCVGSRVVVVDGVTVQRPSVGNRAVATDWQDDRVADNSFAGGGTTDPDELLAALPKTAYAVWPDDTTEDYTRGSGLADTNVFAWLDVPEAMGSSARTAALTQWANDWAAWMDTPVDGIYSGFPPIPHSGFVGSFERYHDGLTAYTRVQAPPAQYQVVTNSPWERPGAPGGGGLTVQEQDGNPSVPNVTTIQIDQDQGGRVTNPAAGTALVSWADASLSDTGVVNTIGQSFSGFKRFYDGAAGESFRVGAAPSGSGSNLGLWQTWTGTSLGYADGFGFRPIGAGGVINMFPSINGFLLQPLIGGQVAAFIMEDATKTVKQGITGNFTAASGEVIQVVGGWLVGATPPLPVPPPSYTLYDTFTDTNGTNITAHTMDAGPGWATDNGTIEIQSNQATMTADTVSLGLLTIGWSDAGISDCTVQADVAVGSATNQIAAVVGRLQDASNYWDLEYRCGDAAIGGPVHALMLVETNATVRTTRAQYDFGGTSPLTGTHTLKLACLGDVLDGSFDGVPYVSYTSSSFNTQTNFGIGLFRLAGTAAVVPVDNFIVP